MQWRLPFTPRNIRTFGKWTFINVQNPKPEILLGKNIPSLPNFFKLLWEYIFNVT